MVIGLWWQQFSAAVLAVLLLGISSLLAFRPQAPSTGPVYTVAALHAQLARDPQAWLDRPLWVRARAGACEASPCLSWQPALSDPSASGSGVSALPLVPGPPSPLVTFLRRLPFIGTHMPAPQELRWDTLTTYSIRLRAVSCRPGTRPPCYEGMLLDAAPTSL